MTRKTIGLIAGMTRRGRGGPEEGKPAPPPPASSDSAAAPKKLAEGVWAMMTKGGANAGWFTFGDSVVAIDAGRTAADAEAILGEITRTTGRKNVAYLILTNDFGPHAGGAPVFARAGATIITHENFVGAIQNLTGSSPLKGNTPPIFGIQDRLVLTRPERHVVVRHLGPADSAGDIAVLLAEDKIVFTGDLVESYLLPPLFSKRSIPPAGSPPWGPWPDSIRPRSCRATAPSGRRKRSPSRVSTSRAPRDRQEARRGQYARQCDRDAHPRARHEDRRLPDDLKKATRANVKALVTWLKTAKAAPAK